MAKENTFDIVSKIDLQEVDNAVNQAMKEIIGRFDFKNSKSKIDVDEQGITILSDNDFKIKNVVEILEAKMVKRGIDLKALQYSKIEKAAGDTVKQKVDLVQGLDKEIGKKIIKLVKDSKLKVQASLQADQVRVSGKNRDDLQAAIKLIKDAEWDVPLQFVNMRTY